MQTYTFYTFYFSMFTLKFKEILFLMLLILTQSCISNQILSFENDDVYYTKEDLLSEEEIEEQLKKEKEDEYKGVDFF